MGLGRCFDNPKPVALIRLLVAAITSGEDVVLDGAVKIAGRLIELGRPVEEVFAHLEQTPLAAASVGQVHAAIQRLLIAGPHSHDWATPQVIHLTRARGVRIA